MKIKVLLIAAVVICLSNPCFSIEIDELRQVIEAMESAYIDIYVDYTWDQDPPMTQEDAVAGMFIPISKRHKTFMTARPFSDRSLSSEKVKLMDGQGRSFNSVTAESYDGNIAKHLSIGGLPRSVTDGTITTRKDFMAMSVTPLMFSVFRFYPDLLSDRLGGTEQCRINSQIVKINGYNSMAVEFIYPSGKASGKAYQRIYFSVDHGYTPVRFEYIKKGVTSLSFDAFDLREVSDGIWFPFKGQIKSVGGKRAEIYEAKTAVLNQGLTDKDFDIKFPPGTRIHDEITGLNYVIRPDGKRPLYIEIFSDKARMKIFWVIIIFSVITILVILGVIRKKDRNK